jgi:glycosyltransferase involved in cell wall biosynthesis
MPVPRFSIVVPAYNAEATLAETLDAVCAQTFGDWECIVVDDGSVDGTLALARSYEGADPRFRVITQENRGTGGAYNAGVSAAGGDWVSICSADDVLLPPHLASMSRAIDEHPECDIFSCNGYFWHPDGSRELVYPEGEAAAAGSWSLEETFIHCFFSVGACYRRSLFDTVGGYLTDVFGEDYDFWLRAMASGARHLYVPEALSLHRKSETQKSANLRSAFESDIRSIMVVLGSGLLSPSQARAARAGIRHRKRLMFELTPIGALASGTLRRVRSLATRNTAR